MARLPDTLVIHDCLVALSATIDREAIYFRSPLPPTRAMPDSVTGRVVVDRDRALCALLGKAVHTSQAVRLLAENGLSGDAFSLARVLLENAVVMSWLIHGPATVRLDTFCLADAPIKARWLEIVEQYYADSPELASKLATIKQSDAREISQQLFNDAHTAWAIFPNEKGKLMPVTVKQMFAGASDAPQSSSFAYDAPYFDASSFVHSGPESTRRLAVQLKRERRFTMSLTPTDSELSARAMNVANVSLALALAAFAEYTGVTNLAFALDPILEHIRRTSRG